MFHLANAAVLAALGGTLPVPPPMGSYGGPGQPNPGGGGGYSYSGPPSVGQPSPGGFGGGGYGLAGQPTSGAPSGGYAAPAPAPVARAWNWVWVDPTLLPIGVIWHAWVLVWQWANLQGLAGPWPPPPVLVKAHDGTVYRIAWMPPNVAGFWPPVQVLKGV